MYLNTYNQIQKFQPNCIKSCNYTENNADFTTEVNEQLDLSFVNPEGFLCEKYFMKTRTINVGFLFCVFCLEVGLASLWTEFSCSTDQLLPYLQYGLTSSVLVLCMLNRKRHDVGQMEGHVMAIADGKTRVYSSWMLDSTY